METSTVHMPEAHVSSSIYARVRLFSSSSTRRLQVQTGTNLTDRQTDGQTENPGTFE